MRSNALRVMPANRLWGSPRSDKVKQAPRTPVLSAKPTGRVTKVIVTRAVAFFTLCRGARPSGTNRPLLYVTLLVEAPLRLFAKTAMRLLPGFDLMDGRLCSTARPDADAA